MPWLRLSTLAAGVDLTEPLKVLADSIPYAFFTLVVCVAWTWMVSRHYAKLNRTMRADFERDRDALQKQNAELLARVLHRGR